ncbi:MULTISPECIES: hypothetical protein [unclassified Novosphingobium]|uniref:hypothetical protein n=1 Tax=unclassified Novosphingobium TaxID=2644732 RepID=UPI0025EF63CB|nr:MULTISPECIES: hypothetical protein [unclassified Novosphingobium]HQS70706.1 hypothetical protein [Novosphingobium sp.]
MKLKNSLAGIAAAALILNPVAASAADAPAAANAKAPAGPSAFVRCDGFPNKASSLGTVARLIAITAVVGLLLPQREAADPKKRQTGADGIKACDEALSGPEPAKDGGRRIELIFGRAIHRMEMQDWDGALADIRFVTADQPELTATTAYQQSLGITAVELEAMVMTGKADFAAAHKLGMELARRTPFDLRAQLAAIRYMSVARAYGEAEAAVYDQAARAWPLALISRADARAAAGQFAGTAADYATYTALIATMPKTRYYASQARAAIAYRLAGNPAEGDRLIKLAMEKAEADIALGKNDGVVTSANEANDLYAILVALDSGQTTRARTLFSARSRWPSISAGMVAGVAQKLDAAATPADRTNIPITSAKDILAAEQARTVAQINDPGESNNDRFATYRSAFAPNEFTKFAKSVWKTDKSRYVITPKVEPENGELISTMRDGSGAPATYAMLLHLALVAKSRGHSHFMMMPGQLALNVARFRTGTPGDGKVFADVAYNAADVIAAISPIIPQPVKK